MRMTIGTLCLPAVVALIGVLGSDLRAQTTITFDPIPPDFRFGIEGYTEAGIVFEDDGVSGGSVILEGTTRVPSNGTAFLSKCGTCRPSMQAIDGGLFDLLALDVGEHLLFGSGPFPATLRVVGTREDGTTTMVDLRTDGVEGFETFFLDENFRDLTRVEFITGVFTAVGIDNLVVVAGADKPQLFVSPSSGTYVTAQSFDLTLITRGSDGARLLQATLDGFDFTETLLECGTPGILETELGTTLRCSLGAAELGVGEHVFEATVELEDGSTASASASWLVLASLEP